MKKYKVVVKEQQFILDNLVEAKQKVTDLFGVGLWFLELSTEERNDDIMDDTHDDIKEDIKDDIKKPKVFKKKEQTKEKRVLKKRTKGRPLKFPEEMKDFCERHMNQNSNQQLAELVNEKFGLNMTSSKIGNYLWLRKLKRENPNRQRAERKEEDTGDIGIIHFNHNGFYACNEAVNPNQKKLSKNWEKVTCANCKRRFKGEGAENLPGESAEDEVKRIKEQREEFKDDEDIDDLELDD